MTTRILRLDASARTEGSVSRELNDRIVDRFNRDGAVDAKRRDLGETPLPFLNAEWIGANFTPADDRNAEQKAALALSDELIAEIKDADILLFGLPIYNFGVPATLKAWVDLIARAGVTFEYSQYGPKGLLEGKRAIISVASGGTEVGSDFDFATTYLRHILAFIGITDVIIVAADRLSLDAEAALEKARDEIEALDLAA
ncbi:MAG: FMN-dependent NADH-azoreductase [Rhodobacteraceae bacterium]|nr:MAG: FMN-dependent NADH-azoreductase [Paracoccaceae bacterium]